jgi:hypothetical protein
MVLITSRMLQEILRGPALCYFLDMDTGYDMDIDVNADTDKYRDMYKDVH